MATATVSRRDTLAAPVTVLAATAAFGLLLGWATYALHGTTPLLERATNSVSAWIVWTAAAGALIRTRPLAVRGGALMMLTTCGGYYAASTFGDTFGAGGLGTAAVWTVAGLAGGPLLGWAGWTVRRGQGQTRAVAGAVIAMVVLGEGLWLGLGLDYWGEAAVFLAVGALLTALLTVYLARARAPRYWLCAVLAPVCGLVFYLAEKVVLDGLLGSVTV
ncbi:DUF6518 family protein [Streptomyces sp. TRM 70361]|uniref:DUF6518 family protein n=1 Tax=Streptomyces sp. TRM 70361 TaxID=3116553 RepID=UPI002E7B9455|nr:DUF6518 family protein [Streptomyces sp. TRM 70361]MEE1940622.1 DUF6518 family protein [Streptomyces sp. TRM 70361]